MADLSSLDTPFDRFLPFVNDDGEPSESRQDYFNRMKQVLPDFPEEVLGQWLYEHWSDVSRYDWLNFPSLHFVHETWATSALLKSGIAEHPMVQVYKRHYEQRIKVARTERIARYMRDHGTWPVAPLLVDNASGSLAYPDGAPLLAPFHPIEGQHRVAVFLSFAQRGRVAGSHVIWRLVPRAG